MAGSDRSSFLSTGSTCGARKYSPNIAGYVAICVRGGIIYERTGYHLRDYRGNNFHIGDLVPFPSLSHGKREATQFHSSS